MKSLIFTLIVLAGAAAVALPGSAAAPREMQLAGIQLGQPATMVAKTHGSPRRVQVGIVTAPQGAAAPGMMGGMPGMGMDAGMGPMDPSLGAMMAPGGGMGYPGAMMAPGGGMGHPGAMGGPGMGSDPGMPGDPSLLGAQPQAPRTVHWIYELDTQGVVMIFGLDEEGRVVAITVGDGYMDSVNRGGTRRPVSSARTAKGIRLGSLFREVVRAYGYPETQQNVGDEVVMTYYDRHGVAFSVRQGVMRVTSITIREMPGSP